MGKRLSAIGYQAFKQVVKDYTRKDLVYVHFSGSKGSDGRSWCEDCNIAEPFIKAALEKYAKEHAVYIYTQVGNKEEWTDRGNGFKTDKDIRLAVLPAIMRWKHQWRLQGGKHCSKEINLEKFFTNHYK